ncbi:MAG: enoyl-CoA hydratase [Solirubrobacterales bacterium]|nr:enoyl-CoA hydratase [Solirubrobacterales bacterium]
MPERDATPDSSDVSTPVAAKEPHVLAERRDAVLLLTLNRPGTYNAWSKEMEAEYFDHLDAADADPGVRAIVLTGAGRGFCAGAEMAQLDELAGSEAPLQLDRTRPSSYALHVRKPIVAAINGGCAAVGLMQALLCDVRFVAAEAKVTTAFVRRGLIAEYGIAWLLERTVGRGRALDLLISGRTILGEEALAIGLAEFSLPRAELLEGALAYADEIARNCSPRAIATIKAQAWKDLERSFGPAAVEADELAIESVTWPDLAEGAASFTERRVPAFPPLAG